MVALRLDVKKSVNSDTIVLDPKLATDSDRVLVNVQELVVALSEELVVEVESTPDSSQVDVEPEDEVYLETVVKTGVDKLVVPVTVPR